MYMKKLSKLLIFGAIGFAVGVALYLSMDGQSADLQSALLFGWLFAGVPYVWKLSGRIIPTVLSLNVPLMFLVFMFRVLFAMITGWVVMPIAIFRCAAGAIREKTIAGSV